MRAIFGIAKFERSKSLSEEKMLCATLGDIVVKVYADGSGRNFVSIEGFTGFHVDISQDIVSQIERRLITLVNTMEVNVKVCEEALLAAQKDLEETKELRDKVLRSLPAHLVVLGE